MDEIVELSRDACWWAKHELGITTAFWTGRKGWMRVQQVKDDRWVRRGTDLYIKEL